MRATAILLVIGLCACPRKDTPTDPGVASGVGPVGAIGSSGSAGSGSANPPPPVEPPAAMSPHGGMIMTIAVSDIGDAAATADDLGGVRLWATLDGKQAPRVVHLASPPKQLTLAKLGDHFLLGSLDQAGGTTLLELDREARILAHATQPADPIATAIVPLHDGLLVQRNDQTLAWFDHHGKTMPPIAPEPGTRIIDLAARRGSVVALIDAGEATTPRWVTATDHLMWSAPIALPVALESIAVSPNHKRLAGFVRGGQVFVIIDLEPAPHLVEPDLGKHVALPENASFGFPADERFVSQSTSTGVQWWTPGQKPTAPDGPAIQALTSPAFSATSPATIGDGIVIAGLQAALTLALDAKTTRFLGYQELAFGNVKAHGAVTTLSVGNHLVWIDKALAAIRSTAHADELGSIVGALDDHRILVAAVDYEKVSDDGAHVPTTVRVRDILAKVDLPIHTFNDYMTLGYSEATNTIAAWSETRCDRYVVDGQVVTPMQPLAVRASSTVYLVDPKQAGGVSAFAVSSDEDGNEWIDAYRDTERAPGKLAPTSLLAAKTRTKYTGQLLGIDGHGVAHILQIADDGKVKLARIEAGKLTVIAPVDLVGPHGEVAHDGSSIVLVTGNEVVMLDAKTAEVRWRFTVWRPHNASFTGDDDQVIVATQGGLIGLEAKTGKRTASSCGWHFGLYEEQANTGSYGATTVCEDSTP